MGVSLPAKLAFWSATFVSCICFVLSIVLAGAAVNIFFEKGTGLAGREPFEIAGLLTLTFQPLAALFLIVRAIRLRGTGRPLWIIARAFCPVFPFVLLPLSSETLRYLADQQEIRTMMWWKTGRITYLCSTHSPSADYNVRTAGPTQLRLTEYRHPDKLGTWIVAWPGKAPIKADSFQAKTGSEGGSQGIKWREPDGRHMVAVLSFSDLVGHFGSETIWVHIAQGDTAAVFLPPHEVPSTAFTCGPDPATYDASG